MHDFLIKEMFNTNIEDELCEIGFDKTYTGIAKDKFEYKNFKIFDLSPAQANIIKQTAISVGADCGTHREVITGKIEKSSCILGGSISQLLKIGDKLNNQPFGLKNLGERITELATKENKRTKTQLVGILNVTPDSFSDGGEYYEPQKAINRITELINDGANIIDIGAETTKPYSTPTSDEEQIRRLSPVLKYISDNVIIPVSIDTRSAVVAQFAIDNGAKIINDVSGLEFDSKMADVISNNNVKVIIQHSKGNPENMQDHPTYENVIDEIFLSLKNKIDYAISKGILKENIIIDPGIGFGKTQEDNFKIIRRWKEFRSLGYPILIGLSRKSLLGMQDAENIEKDIYSLALNSILINEGVDYIRVHNVKMHKRFMDILSE